MGKTNITNIKKLYTEFEKEITGFGYKFKIIESGTTEKELPENELDENEATENEPIENEIYVVSTTTNEQFPATYKKVKHRTMHYTINASINSLPLNICLCPECISMYYGGANVSSSFKKLMTYKKHDYNFETTELFKGHNCVFTLSQYGKELTIQAKVSDENNNLFSWIFRVYKDSKNIFYETCKRDSLGAEQVRSGIETYYMMVSKKGQLEEGQTKSEKVTDCLVPTNILNIDKCKAIVATGKQSPIMHVFQDFPDTSFSETLQAMATSPSISKFIDIVICVLNARFPGLEETIQNLVTDLYPTSNKNIAMGNYVDETLKTIALEDMIDIEGLLPAEVLTLKKHTTE